MSDNKFILQLKGTQTPKSVVEIKNDKLVAPFTGVPHSTDVVGSIIDDKDSSAVVAKGAQNWKLDGSSLVVASSLSGDGSDYTGEFNVSGSGLWINATYSLPATIFSAGTKWALKLCGKNLLTTSGQTIGFTLVVKIGNTHITSKTFTVAEGANVFCRQLVIDFSESEQAIIKAQSGDSLTVQLLCSDTNASATIYNGMTVFTALQRRVDGDAVASDTKTFEELEAISDAHISNKNNPHEVTKAQVGLGNCDNTSDLDKPISTATQTALDGKVNDTGDTLTGMYNHAYGSRTRYMAANSTVNYTDLFMNGQEFEILFHTSNSIYDGLYGRATNGYVTLYPGTDNQAWLGLGSRRWNRIFVTQLCPNTTNILTLPNKTDVLATKGDVDLAANSGDQLTEKGVWYAKMYSATVAPSAEDGTNYADFSQTDNQGNPIIVIYKRQNGAWVQDQTITPPAEYNGYVPVTSKIWDIVEQAGQQGGKVLWSHNQKTFTPSPLIISFEDIEITGDSTVVMPQNPGTNQIVNKDYVDEAIAAIPAVNIKQSIDAEIVGTLTVADNGDVSGSWNYNTNYLHHPCDLVFTGANTFEIVIAFTTSNTYSSSRSFSFNNSQTTYLGMDFGASATSMESFNHIKLRVGSGTSNTYQTITGTTNLETNTKYYAKLVYDGTDYILSVSTDGVNYTVDTTVAAQYVPSAGNLPTKLYGSDSNGTIYLSECYIKKNDILIWSGMDSPGLHQRVVKGHEVIAFQAPTAANNYTWYRKYADGWVEQGGHTTSQNVTFPITMADTNYHVLLTGTATQSNNNVRIVGFRNATTTSMVLQCNVVNQSSQTSSANDGIKYWEIRGMAA